jgi:ubiquinone/menaquinone biosynthesis C-methylase UbiE
MGLMEKGPTRTGFVTHSRTVESEFQRQALEFSSSPDLNAAELTEPILRAVAELESPRVLDVACGPGVVALPLAQAARCVVGLDLTRETLRVAQQRSSGKTRACWVQGCAERPPFEPECFDAAVLRLALHHIEDPVAVLRSVRELLRPGGRVIVLDILTSSDPSIAELHNAIERLRDPSHTTLVPLDQLKSQLARAGFEVTEERCWDSEREFDGWARIISEPRRMASLEVVLRQLARAGIDAGMGLCERDGRLRFTYTWGFLVAGTASPAAGESDASQTAGVQ